MDAKLKEQYENTLARYRAEKTKIGELGAALYDAMDIAYEFDRRNQESLARIADLEFQLVAARAENEKLLSRRPCLSASVPDVRTVIGYRCLDCVYFQPQVTPNKCAVEHTDVEVHADQAICPWFDLIDREHDHGDVS